MTVITDEDAALREAVFVALGEVSMCWEPRPVGVFESREAKRVGDELLARIKELTA